MSQNSSSLQRPTVSIIMNCYNGERYLREAIESVLSQSYSQWELVFLDNASTDQTEKIVRCYQDSRIKYYRNPINVPLGEARNLALDYANGKYLAFLDTDDKWHPQKLEWQIEYFEKHLDIDFLYTDFLTFTDRSASRPLKLSLRKPSGNVFGKFLKKYPVNLQTVMLRKDRIVERNLRFDPSLHVSEEFDLFMQLFHDCKVGYLNKITCQYRIHPNQDSNKKIHLYVTESQKIYQRLQEKYPETIEQHKKEYQIFSAKIDYYKARELLRNNKKQEAFSLVRPHAMLDWRFLALTIALLLPHNFITLIHKLTGRYI